jgi:hypothetical protein
MRVKAWSFGVGLPVLGSRDESLVGHSSLVVDDHRDGLVASVCLGAN